MLHIATLTTLRQSYAAERTAAVELGFTGDFKAACRKVLGKMDLTPFEWVRAAAAVRVSMEPDFEDEREPSGPGYDEPWEVANGPRTWESVYA
ncbi:MAG: hypothetical protein A2Y38_10415 [Spirochaetes bacterium GWB1_59_5]|nr:MAG: hypothetical protein A2Y38_10415 [Spirochaetes bacterium GWB1_59_5]